MPYRQILLLTLVSLGTVGVTTILLVLSPTSRSPHLMWWFFLVILPIGLAAAIIADSAWAAMLCVAYGTIGLALDLATIASIVGGRQGSDFTLTLSVVSGSVNLVLIVFGGRACWTLVQQLWPRGSRPPNPPIPSSSSPG